MRERERAGGREAERETGSMWGRVREGSEREEGVWRERERERDRERERGREEWQGEREVLESERARAYIFFPLLVSQ